MIKIEGLSKNYGRKEVLRNISLEFKPGQVYGIAGENGAGKTTLFKCITGLEIYEGTIESDFDVLKNHIGYLPTIPYFFSMMTGYEYIKLLCNARNIKNIDINSRNIFDLPLNEYAVNYSTGMKKKLALTAILCLKNDIYIFDEPFNGVDIQSNIIITHIIEKLKSLNKTILISSHIFSTLQETCDQIHLLKNGMISKSVNKEQFIELDKEMRDILIGGKIDKLNLQ